MDRVDYQSIVIQDLYNLAKKEELDLNPWYQRRSVWTESQKSYLLNTLFEFKPIPALYIRHSLDMEQGKSIKEVVDGQQRSRAIIEYLNDGFTAKHPNYQKRIKFSKLSKPEREKLLLTSIPVGYLQGATDIDVIDIFARINSVSKTLNSQEKRNANFSGEFKQFCVEQAVSRLEFWRNYEIFTANDIARMNEVQFMSDLIIDMLDGLNSYSSSKLDKYYKDYDEEFSEAKNISDRLNSVFDVLVNVNPRSIIDTIFRRPPILFSLIMVIDSTPKITSTKVENSLYKIDSIFNSDTPIAERKKEDISFYNASSSTTQGREQRKTRDKYIRKFLK